jgi:hypothetical protein
LQRTNTKRYRCKITVRFPVFALKPKQIGDPPRCSTTGPIGENGLHTAAAGRAATRGRASQLESSRQCRLSSAKLRYVRSAFGACRSQLPTVSLLRAATSLAGQCAAASLGPGARSRYILVCRSHKRPASGCHRSDTDPSDSRRGQLPGEFVS